MFIDEFKPSHLKLEAVSACFWRVTFDNPPVNVIGPKMIADLKNLLTELETNETVKVVVFDSADPDFYLAHYDLAANPAEAEALPSPTGYAAWVDVLVRMSHLPTVTISAIRGIARGAGSEFVLATDLRFASREKAILGQMEVGFTALPGGGAAGRLPAQVGRGRTFEILLGGEDYSADLAERYGYVNRAIADAEFQEFVDAYATRVSKWDRRVITEIKTFVNKYTLLPDEEFPPQSDAFWGAAARPEFQSITGQLLANGLQTRGDLEYNLGAEMGRVFPRPEDSTLGSAATSPLPRKALIAMTSHSAPFYPDGRVNGVFYTEVAHPYQALTEAGFQVDLASETGSFVIDAYSMSEEFLDERDIMVLNDPNHPFSLLLKNGVHKASELSSGDYGMFFASAGFASVYDYPSASSLQSIAQDVWKRGGVVAAVCHGGAIFPGVVDETSKKSIIAGRKVTGFSTEGDRLAGVLTKIHEDGVKTTEESAVSAGADYAAPPEPFGPFSVSSGRIVTGANPASAHITAAAAIEAFEKL